MMARTSCHFGRSAIVVTLCTLSGTAIAADPSAADRETARDLGARGIQALESKDFADAERDCRGAFALVEAPTVGTCLAHALEGLGRLVEARDVFVHVTLLPVKPDEPAVFTRARETAKTAADSLATRIPTVTFVVVGPSQGQAVQVTVDGTQVKPETALLPRRLDPGPHALHVSAAGFEAMAETFSMTEGEDRRLEVKLRPASPGPTSPTETKRASGAEEPPRSTFPMAAIAVGGVGLAGIVVGIAAGVASTSKHSTLAGECNTMNYVCPPSASGDLDAFHTLRTVSAIGYAIGAVGLLGSGALYLAFPRAASVGSVGLLLGPSACAIRGAF
jgi:hypothetical protein